jgi:hypothetical protein
VLPARVFSFVSTLIDEEVQGLLTPSTVFWKLDAETALR